MREKLTIEGMSCGHCVAAVRKALDALEGVEPEQVEIGTAVVRYESDRVAPGEVDAAIRNAGYEPVSRERVGS